MRVHQSLLLLFASLLRPSATRADWVSQYNYPLWNLGCQGTPIGGRVVGSGQGGCFAYDGGSALYTCASGGARVNITSFPSTANCTGPEKPQPPLNGTGTCALQDTILLEESVCGTSASWPLPAPQTFLINAWPSSDKCWTPPLAYVNFLALPIPCLSVPVEARPRLAVALAEARRGAEGVPREPRTSSLRGDADADADADVDVGLPIPLSMQITGCNSDKSMTLHVYTALNCSSGDVPNTFGPTGCITGDPSGVTFSVVCEGGSEQRDESVPVLTGGTDRLLQEMVKVVTTAMGGSTAGSP